MDENEPRIRAHADFLRLFLAAEQDVYRYVCALIPRPQEAQDVVQETAVALWENFDRFDHSRPFVAWALRFALNKVRQHAHREGKRPFLLDDEALLEKIVAEQEEQRTDFEERRLRLQHCLEKLSAAQAALVRGYYWDRLDIEVLAQRTRSSGEAVYKRLQRIRGALLECIQQFEGQHTGA